MSRILVFGDIHGGLRGLTQAMERAAVAHDDKLIFLGDYVDGWSDSFGVLNYLIELSGKQECVFIKGNHDVWCEEWLRTGTADKKWLFHGGASTVESYDVADEATRQIHLNFFEQMKMFFVDDKDRLFIHAGFTSMHGPEQEFYTSNFSWDRTLWEMALTMDKRIRKDSMLFPKRLKIYNEIYIGHTPTLYYEEEVPMQGCNVWNMDTGAAFHGRLTVMDIDTKDFWQSDKLTILYPAEMGRNKI